jgi:hypothetical protein
MEFVDDLSVPAKFLMAVVVALATLGVGGYLVRRSSGPRGRQPRLAVINTASLDGLILLHDRSLPIRFTHTSTSASVNPLAIGADVLDAIV